MAEIYILNGPNLNLLGLREPDIYGHETLGDLEDCCCKAAKKLNATIIFRQTNHEGQLIDWVQEARLQASGLILNAGALSHSSIALHDALRVLTIPIIEVHLSNIYKREPFRHHSFVSSVASGVICGFGAYGYEMALLALSYKT